MRILMILVLSGTLGILGCDSTSDGTGGSVGSGGSGGSGGTGGSGGGTAGSGGGAGAGGGGGEAGGGGGASAEAIDFCDDFEDTCAYGTGNNYGDRADCLSSYDGYNAGRQSCVMTHLTNAENSSGGERDAHCGHASGEAPCS